jgi:hypothetical protein
VSIGGIWNKDWTEANGEIEVVAETDMVRLS